MKKPIIKKELKKITKRVPIEGKDKKSPAKFIGAIGLTKGLLGGVRDVIQNKKAATAAGQDYSFKEGLGDFAVGGLNQVLGPNRAGMPERSVNNLQAINTIQDPGMQSAQQAAAYQKFNNIAQYTPPPTMMKYKK